MIKALINKIKNEYYWHRISKSLYNHHQKIMMMQKIHNNKVDGEEEWQKYFTIGKYKPNPIYYRLFSNYIGNQQMIVPEDISCIFWENILNSTNYLHFY